ncbi:hypothetical protein An01g05717 [Aspergillus niger]|uniref:Uncharacterized protein n=2 Tax=Aspergillus niger TaxID=5061 RepID=A2Q8V6_ASPNC|nr:hypothetical protein An01g05717 [Aspergillus niger]CAK43739.1 hypothetical protein An01g05717 [Aspergillus niger]
MVRHGTFTSDGGSINWEAFRRSAFLFWLCCFPLISVPGNRRMEIFPMGNFDCQVAMSSKIAVKSKSTASNILCTQQCLLKSHLPTCSAED